eukprot:601005-Amphidinium_carterae.1
MLLYDHMRMLCENVCTRVACCESRGTDIRVDRERAQAVLPRQHDLSNSPTEANPSSRCVENAVKPGIGRQPAGLGAWWNQPLPRSFFFK